MPLNYRLVAADHEYIINHAGVTVVLVDHEYAAIVDEIRPSLTTVEHWIVGAGRRATAPAGLDGLGRRSIDGQPTSADAARRAGRERRRRRSTTPPARRRGRRA